MAAYSAASRRGVHGEVTNNDVSSPHIVEMRLKGCISEWWGCYGTGMSCQQGVL